MRYEGNTCPGCGEIFTQDDDVVVCPECGTAQHRECYNKKGECVNAQFHSEDFQWQPENGLSHESASTLVKQDSDKKLMDCPVCHCKCDPDKGYCDKCGTKFVMFGKNLAKEIQKEQEKSEALKNQKTENENINENTVPAYKPPFEIGVGEGFDETQEHKGDTEQKLTAEQVQQSIIEALGGTGEKYPEDGVEKLYFKGPYTVKDKIDGVSANAVGTFVRSDALRYIDKFRRMDGGRFVFNWGAFFFSPFWFFYRRLYKPGIIFMTIELLIAVFSTYFSFEMVAEMVNMGIPADAVMTYEELYGMVNEEMIRLSFCTMACMTVLMLSHIVAGVIANRLYKKYVIEKVRFMERKNTMNEALLYAAKNGGVSLSMGLFSLSAYMFGNYIIGMFFV